MLTSRRNGTAGKTGLIAGLIVLIWLSYTIMQTSSVMGGIREDVYALIAFLPGILGVAILFAVGQSRQDCYLQVRRPSWVGIAALIAIAILALATVLPFGEWQGWNWRGALLYAPASGISQELFFRSALLPAMGLLFKGRSRLALVSHSVLFGLWHIAPLFLGAPLWAVFAVMFVPFMCGIGWGWQVRRDQTVIWAMLQHSLIWVIGNQFPLTV